LGTNYGAKTEKQIWIERESDDTRADGRFADKISVKAGLCYNKLLNERWNAMLKLVNLFENSDLAKEALSHWEHDGKGLDEMLAQFRISSNAIYPFRRHGNVCFLRLAPVEEKREENLRGELAFIAYLRAHGFPAAGNIPADTGETLLRLPTRWGEHYACVFEGAPGVRVDRTDMRDEVLRVCGETLARLHLLSQKYEPKTGAWSYTDALDWARAQFDADGEPPCAYAALDGVRNELDALEKTRANFGLVHFDFEPDNLFFDETTKTCTAIDFEDGMLHFYALDIAKALAAIGEEAQEIDGADPGAAKQAFLEGYDGIVPITAETEALFPLMRRFQTAFAYARILYCMRDRPENGPEWMQNLVVKLNAFLRELEAEMKDRQEGNV